MHIFLSDILYTYTYRIIIHSLLFVCLTIMKGKAETQT